MDSDWQSSIAFMPAVIISVHKFCSDVFVVGSFQQIKAHQHIRASRILPLARILWTCNTFSLFMKLNSRCWFHSWYIRTVTDFLFIGGRISVQSCGQTTDISILR